MDIPNSPIAVGGHLKSLLFTLVLVGGSLLASGCIAQSTGTEERSGTNWTGWILPIAFIAILWFVLMRPQQRKAKMRREMLKQIEVGDEVLLTSGIYGRVIRFDQQTVFIAIDDSVEIKVSRESIAERITYSAEDYDDGKKTD